MSLHIGGKKEIAEKKILMILGFRAGRVQPGYWQLFKKK